MTTEIDGIDFGPLACLIGTWRGDDGIDVVRYHQLVCRKSNNKVFHNETCYLTWNAQGESVTQSFAIPRGVSVVAVGEGNAVANGCSFEVTASGDDISQTDFMKENARTEPFTHKIEVIGDSMSYSKTTMLKIYVQTFKHTDLSQADSALYQAKIDGRNCTRSQQQITG